jgi:hypothetical protein
VSRPTLSATYVYMGCARSTQVATCARRKQPMGGCARSVADLTRSSWDVSPPSVQVFSME